VREAVLASAVPRRIAAGAPVPAGLPALRAREGPPFPERRPAVSPAEAAAHIAVLLRGEDGIADVRVRADGFLLIVLAVPGEIVREIVEGGPSAVPSPSAVLPGSAVLSVSTWPDLPRTWDNPGFAVRFAYARAAAVRRWASALGVPGHDFRPELLDHPSERAVLRLLAELPSRTESRDPRWAAYAERLALAYHDAHEQAWAVPRGDEPVGEVHTARLWLARAVQEVLTGLLGPELPERL
jgi:arginyl-tRNA synthetase